jgi:hypothetical protein
VEGYHPPGVDPSDPREETDVYYNPMVQVIRRGGVTAETEENVYRDGKEDLDGPESSEESCLSESEDEVAADKVPSQDQFLDYVEDLESKNQALREMVGAMQDRMKRDHADMEELIQHADSLTTMVQEATRLREGL